MSLAVQVDGNGLTLKSFREVREELVSRFQGIFGTSIDLSPSSPDGQLLDLFCYAYSDAAEAIQAVAANLDVNSARGTFLDNIGTMMGVPRNGRDDDEYRVILQSSTTTGLATYDNMLTYLRANIDNGVNLVENPEPVTDSNGIPGHHFAVYVPGGFSARDENDNDVTDDFIAGHIWKCKPGGIKSFGTSSGIAEDVAQQKHTVQFFKVTATTPYYMRITITEYEEESLPVDFATEIAKAVADWALREYKPGKDIIPKRAIQAIYEVPGIDDVVIEVSADGSTGWTEERVPIALDHYASIPQSNITVTKET